MAIRRISPVSQLLIKGVSNAQISNGGAVGKNVLFFHHFLRFFLIGFSSH